MVIVGLPRDVLYTKFSSILNLVDRGTSTLLMGERKAILLKNHYFHVLTSLLEQKFHADFKNDLKKFHIQYEMGMIF